jgi:hypothetical protein
VALFRHEQRHSGGQSDCSQIAGNRAEQHQNDECPESHVPEIAKCPIRGQQVDHPSGRVRGQREQGGCHHGRFASVPINEGAEDQAGRGEQQHVRAPDHRGGGHRAGLQEHPERQRKPQKAIGDTGQQTVGYQTMKSL